MRIGIFSDVHANAEALTLSLELLAEAEIDRLFCLGDVVGYGADPVECLKRVREVSEVILAGNHDHAAVGLADLTYFNPHARAAAIWTAGQLDEESQSFLRELPYDYVEDDALFVHASPHEPEEWHYIVSLGDAMAAFPAFTESICFVGHSHVAGIYCDDGGEPKDRVALQPGRRYLVNVGSVGQPRDGDPRLACAIFDREERTVVIMRVEYDIEAAAGKIRAAGLPRLLADRLYHGV